MKKVTIRKSMCLTHKNCLVLVSAFLVSLVLTTALPTTGLAQGLSGGGGNTIRARQNPTDANSPLVEMTVARYLDSRRLRGERLQRLHSVVENNIAEVTKVLPGFGRQLTEVFANTDWHLIDVPLDLLPFGSTSIPFNSNQTSRQIGRSVFTVEENFNRLSDRDTHLMQEILERLMYTQHNVNANINNLSVMQAAALLTSSPLPDADTLRNRLRELGFEMPGGRPFGQAQLPNGSGFVYMPVALARPISVREGQLAIDRCLSSEKPHSLFTQVFSILNPSFTQNRGTAVPSVSDLERVDLIPMTSGIPNPSGSYFAGFYRAHRARFGEATELSRDLYEDYRFLITHDLRTYVWTPGIRFNEFPEVLFDRIGPLGDYNPQNGSPQSERLVNNITLRLPQNAWEKENIAVENVVTQVPVPRITFNVRQVMNCMREELELASAQPQTPPAGVRQEPGAAAKGDQGSAATGSGAGAGGQAPARSGR